MLLVEKWVPGQLVDRNAKLLMGTKYLWQSVLSSAPLTVESQHVLVLSGAPWEMVT